MMKYSFKDEVIKRLPFGHRLINMRSISATQTVIDTVKEAMKQHLTMDKVDLSNYFMKIPTLGLLGTATYNDLYEAISQKFSLDLIKNVDYYDSRAIKPSQVPQYVELPITATSIAYCGVIRCRVVLGLFDGISDSVRDLRSHGQYELAQSLKLELFLMGNLFTIDGTMFVEDKLTKEFATHIGNRVSDNIDYGTGLALIDTLSNSLIVDCFTDGLSDIILVKLPDNELITIRFTSHSDDLPIIKNNESLDLETSASKEVFVEDTNGVSEDPDEGKGELLYTAECSDIPNPSLSVSKSKKKSRKK